MEHLSNDQEDHPNQHMNSHKPCDETRHPGLSLLESQWKLRQQHDQDFPVEEKQLQNKHWHQKKERNRKDQDCVRDASRKVNHLSKVI